MTSLFTFAFPVKKFSNALNSKDIKAKTSGQDKSWLCRYFMVLFLPKHIVAMTPDFMRLVVFSDIHRSSDRPRREVPDYFIQGFRNFLANIYLFQQFNQVLSLF